MSDLYDQVQDHDDRLTALEDALSSTPDDIQALDDRITELESNAGQLTYPLSQDTIDLIKEQFPTGKVILSAGVGTIKDARISASSTLLFSFVKSSGLPLIAVGDKHIYYEITTQSDGVAVVTSSIATDASTLSYLIL